MVYSPLPLPPRPPISSLTPSPHHPVPPSPPYPSQLDTDLLQAVLESWFDGIMILTTQGDRVQVNETAHRLCQRLGPCPKQASEQHPDRHCQCNPENYTTSPVPISIWQICQFLIDHHQTLPQASGLLHRSMNHAVNHSWHDPVIIEAEIPTQDGAIVRVRVRWLMLEAMGPCLLVILEDRHQTDLHRAMVEVDRYGLSPREAEVWLLYRTHYTYEKIAQQLYISVNTVKKHLKNSRLKMLSHS